MAPKRKSRNPDQGDLFDRATLYPVRERVERPRALDLSLSIKTELGRALKECPLNAFEVAAKMSELLCSDITRDALYSYTAPSKPEHEISLLRFIAFVRVTGATWLWDVLVEPDGLLVVEGREAHLARLGHLEQERQQIDAEIGQIKRELKAEPVRVGAGPRRRPGA
jgi:hypothetical protein